MGSNRVEFVSPVCLIYRRPELERDLGVSQHEVVEQEQPGRDLSASPSDVTQRAAMTCSSVEAGRRASCIPR